MMQLIPTYHVHEGMSNNNPVVDRLSITIMRLYLTMNKDIFIHI